VIKKPTKSSHICSQNFRNLW